MKKVTLVAVALIAAAGAWYVVRSVPSPEAENAAAPEAENAAAVSGGVNANAEAIPNESGEGQGFQLTGTIRVAPELADRSKQIGTVYVMVRSAAGGPPYAVTRLSNPRDGAEIPFELSPANVMLPGSPPPADARVIVRFDADGSAGPEAPGDLVGETGISSLSGSKVDVLVSREGGVRAQ